MCLWKASSPENIYFHNYNLVCTLMNLYYSEHNTLCYHYWYPYALFPFPRIVHYLTSTWWLQMVKNSSSMQKSQVQLLGLKDPLKKGMATCSRVLAYRISWTEQPGQLQPMGSQRVRHDWATENNSNTSRNLVSTLFFLVNYHFFSEDILVFIEGLTRSFSRIK